MGVFLLLGNATIGVVAVVLAVIGAIPWVLAVPVSAWMTVMAFLVGRELWEDWA